MKFILNRDSDKAINIASIKEISIENYYTREDARPITCVEAKRNGSSSFVIKSFAVGNEDENFRAAQKYLAELINRLNGGAA